MSKIEEATGQGLVVFAKNIQQVSAFYEGTLRLTKVEEESSHHVLQGRGLELVIHAIPEKIADSIRIDEPPKARSENPLKPTFSVEDLEEVRAAAMKAGGYLKPASAAWKIGGALVLDGWDPEGNIVQFKQKDG